jgi:N-methylhydantoinase B
VLPPIGDGTRVRRGDVIGIETAGGGGYGHPYDREPERVRQDVLGGFVSLDAARREYGVALTDEHGIDWAETELLRRERFPSKLFHRGEYRDAMT